MNSMLARMRRQYSLHATPVFPDLFLSLARTVEEILVSVIIGFDVSLTA